MPKSNTCNTYFLIPLDQVPSSSARHIWFVTWSENDRSFCLSTERPTAPDSILPWAVGAVATELAAGGADLGRDPKDRPPPVTLPLPIGSPSQTAFRDEFVQWLTARNDEEKPGTEETRSA